MSFGKNLQNLRQLSAKMTQETLAEKLNVSRQTVSKWEMDAAKPEMDKALEICRIFNCSLDNLFREEMDKRSDAYSELRVEDVAGFSYIEHTVISTEPESDAIGRMYKTAKENGIENPRVIGWDFPNLSQEQVNVFNMHGYTAALVLPGDVKPEGYQIKEQSAHKYAAIHIERPFENPFVTIPGAYHTLFDFMRTNGLEHTENDVIPSFETDGENMSLQFVKASTSDALTLTGISKRSFDSDALTGDTLPGGPPGYMSVPFHTKMARQGHLYKLTEEGLIIGGAILFLENDVLNVGRIFVAPEHFRKGYGLFIMQEVENMFPEVREYTLDTPIWNVRTNSFYTKLGYKETKRDKEFVFYSKRRGESAVTDVAPERYGL